MVRYNKILVGFDGSGNGLTALDSAKRIALEQQSLLTVLYVQEQPLEYSTSAGMNPAGEQYMLHSYMGQGGVFRVEQFLQEKSDAFNTEDKIATQIIGTAKSKLIDIPNVTYQRIRGKPATVIATYANEHDMDMVVVGNRGVNALKKLFVGSVSKKVTNDAKCPVLVVK